MKILKRDLKHDKIVIKLENPDDLWNLEKILEKGDKISGKTLRRKTIRRGNKDIRAEKERVWLKIEMEKVEFHEHTGKLRITGPILGGDKNVSPGSYHTFVGDENKVLTIEKDWKDWQIDELKKSLAKVPKVLVCTMDDKEAYLYEVTDKINFLTEIDSQGSGKMYGDEGNKYREFFGQVKSFLEGKEDEVSKIVVAGPGFFKESFLNFIDDEELEEKIIKVDCSHVGEPGLQEVIRRGVIERISKESRLSEETKIVEEILKNLSKETGKVAYGEEEVNGAIEMGAAERTIVTRNKIRNYEDLLKKTEDKGGKTFIVSGEHEAAQKLENLGGIASLLRYRIR
ncbi:MAG: mRNA surveillance protein pelota [Candidatus Aenigmatarchaeota archaeon]